MTTTNPSETCDGPCRDAPRAVGTFRTALAPEASGLAASRRNPGLLYVLDDGPGTTSLLVLRARNARPLGTIAISGLDGVDTESLAVGPCGSGDGASCIYVGDIGDNTAARTSVSVVRIPEPDLRGGLPDGDLDSDAIALRYPDGARNAEALVVDDSGSLLIITKAAGRRGRGAARLYTTTGFADQTLTAGGRLRLPPASLPLAAAVVGHVVTGADAASGRLALRTYDAIFEFTAPPGNDDLSTLARWRVREIPSPPEPQGEAIAYGADGCSIYTVSEDSPTLHVLKCH